MARVPKSLEEARANFEAAIPHIPDRYRRGIERGEWEKYAASDDAEKNFNSAMSKVIAEKKRQKGCRGKEGLWKAGAINKGAPVIGERIRMNLDKYMERFRPVYDAIIATQRTLPPRTIDPLAHVDNRLKPIVQAAYKAGKRGRS
jgi:hypothetical protein